LLFPNLDSSRDKHHKRLNMMMNDTVK